MLNLTLTALSISNLYSFSSLFYFKRSISTFSSLKVQNIFSPAIITESPIFITNSKFKNVLSSSVELLSSKAENIFNETQVGHFVQNSLFDRCQSTSSGGGLYCDNAELTVTYTLFAYCESIEKGGAIYAYSSSKKSVTIRNTRALFCSAPEGASFYVNNADKIDMAYSEIEESAPYRRSGIESNGFFSTSANRIEEVNFTSCYSQLSSAALFVDCSESQKIKFSTFQGCNGCNILCLKGICFSDKSSIEKVVMIDNFLNENSIENDRHDGNALICVMGEWKISDSFFVVTSPNVVSGGFGAATFFRCTFNIESKNLESNYNYNGVFLECIYKENVSLPSYSFTANEIEYEGNLYRGETQKIDSQLPKPKFVLKKRIGYIVSAIVLTVVFLVVTIVACILLRRHRNHVLVMLHKTYAAEAQSNDGENINDNINDKDLVAVVNEDDKKKNEMKKRDLENDFDDFYHLTRKDNRFQFDNVEVPDTHLWDTDEGETLVTDDDAFFVDVKEIIDGFIPDAMPKKGKKKKKKSNH